MKIKRIIFFGLGGAGQRHLKIIYKIFSNYLFYAVRKVNKVGEINDNFKLTKKTLEQKYKKISFFKNINILSSKKLDYAFVSNHTSGHYKVAKICALNKINIFSEKPFFCTLAQFDQLQKIINKYKLKFLVGYQRRFHPLVLKLGKIIKKNINEIKIVNIKVSSYVPDWHLYEDFKNLYACKKQLGGGALLTECHEIDLVIYFFGLPEEVLCKKKFKRSDINVESGYYLKLSYSNFNVIFDINMFDKNNSQRTIFIKTIKNSYLLDLQRNYLIYGNKKITTSAFSNKLQFIRQIKFFFSNYFDKKNSLLQARKNLLILIAAIKSHRYDRVITL